MNGREMIVFDVDGVLVDPTGSYRETIRRTVAHFTGRAISFGDIQDYKNRGGYNNDSKLTHKIIADLGVEVEYELIKQKFKELFWGDGANGLVLGEQWIPREGVLERLAGRYDFALFTGRAREEAQRSLDRFVPGMRFSPIIGMRDVERQKPAPEGLLKIASAHPGRKLWYVGDTVDDSRSAREAGIAFIGIAAPGSPRQREVTELLYADGAEAVLEDINQLEAALANGAR